MRDRSRNDVLSLNFPLPMRGPGGTCQKRLCEAKLGFPVTGTFDLPGRCFSGACPESSNGFLTSAQASESTHHQKRTLPSDLKIRHLARDDKNSTELIMPPKPSIAECEPSRSLISLHLGRCVFSRTRSRVNAISETCSEDH